jgi:hypothetical protein
MVSENGGGYVIVFFNKGEMVFSYVVNLKMGDMIPTPTRLYLHCKPVKKFGN